MFRLMRGSAVLVVIVLESTACFAGVTNKIHVANNGLRQVNIASPWGTTFQCQNGQKVANDAGWLRYDQSTWVQQVDACLASVSDLWGVGYEYKGAYSGPWSGNNVCSFTMSENLHNGSVGGEFFNPNSIVGPYVQYEATDGPAAGQTTSDHVLLQAYDPNATQPNGNRNASANLNIIFHGQMEDGPRNPTIVHPLPTVLNKQLVLDAKGNPLAVVGDWHLITIQTNGTSLTDSWSQSVTFTDSHEDTYEGKLSANLGPADEGILQAIGAELGITVKNTTTVASTAGLTVFLAPNSTTAVYAAVVQSEYTGTQYLYDLHGFSQQASYDLFQPVTQANGAPGTCDSAIQIAGTGKP